MDGVGPQRHGGGGGNQSNLSQYVVCLNIQCFFSTLMYKPTFRSPFYSRALQEISKTEF